MAVEQNVAGRRAEQSGEEADEGRFAGAVGTDEGGEGRRFYCEAYGVDGARAAGIGEFQGTGFHEGHARRPPVHHKDTETRRKTRSMRRSERGGLRAVGLVVERRASK